MPHLLGDLILHLALFYVNINYKIVITFLSENKGKILPTAFVDKMVNKVLLPLTKRCAI